MSAWRLAVRIGVTALAILTAAGASAQSGGGLSAGSPPRETRSVRWARAVQAHAAGEADQALETIAAWRHAQTLAVLRSAPAVRYDAPFLQRALTLHTDIAIVERAEFDRRLPAALVGKVLLLDPTRADAVERAFQWDVARMLAERLVADPAGTQAARLWYRATSAMLQQWGDCAALRPHLQAALKLWPDDPALLLVAGTLHQTFADVRVQRYVGGATDLERVRPVIGGVMGAPGVAQIIVDNGLSGRQVHGSGVAARIGTADAETELERAEEAFRRLLAAGGQWAEARVRLAHVQVRRNRPADALATLEPLRGATVAPRVAYYEAMVRGRALDAVGQQREALAAFERAAVLLPGAQSARIAISRQALIDGHPIDGLQSLVDALGPGTPRDSPASDPWYDYFRFHEPDAKTLLASFRATTQ